MATYSPSVLSAHLDLYVLHLLYKSTFLSNMLPTEDSSKHGSIRTRETATKLFTLTNRTIIGGTNLNSTLMYEILTPDPILVTGSMGRLGLALIQTTLESGADVVAIGRLERAEGEAWGMFSLRTQPW